MNTGDCLNKIISCKIFKIMKNVLLLMIITVFQVYAAEGYSQNTKLTLNLDNVTVGNVLEEIENQSEFYFLFNAKLIDIEREVSISIEDQRISNILAALFSGTGVSSTVHDRLIILTPGDLDPGVPEIIQQQTVNGTVTDSQTGEAMPGVNILVIGTSLGAITDASGSYSITVTDRNATLRFSFIGYVTQEVALNGRSTIDVNLISEVTGLDEVVVIGYGTKTRATMTGAVDVVDARKAIQARPVSNSLNALQGIMSGVTVTRTGGKPGDEGFDLQIRGASSINGGTPLILIDGIEGDLNMINPQDIDKFTVLKDAAAAIYGARASNGVILVTTIRGSRGKPNIRISSNFALRGIGPSSYLEKPSLYQVMLMYNEAHFNAGEAKDFSEENIAKAKAEAEGTFPFLAWGPEYIFDYSCKGWMEEALSTGWQHNQNMSISGGGEKSNYLLSVGNLYQKGNLRYGPDSYDRKNVMMNYDFDISDRFSVFTKLAYDQDSREEVQCGASHIFDMLQTEWSGTPIYSDVSGKYYTFFENPIAFMRYGGVDKFFKTNITINLKAVYKITNDLSLTGQFGNNFSTNYHKNETKKIPMYDYEGNQTGYEGGTNPNYAREDYNRYTYNNFTAFLNYDKTLADNHKIDLMIGASQEEQDNKIFWGQRKYFTNEEVFALDLGDANYQYSGGKAEDWAIRSIFSRIGYAYKGKYLFETNLRYDGSSRFYKDTRWGFFPGVMVAWRISDESFMEDISWLDNMKIRLSVGQSGNQSGIKLYDYVQLIKIGLTYPFGTGVQAQSAWLDGMASKARTWETVETQNIGIDLGLFNSKLDITFDYFIKNNKDMLVSINLPQVLGITPPRTNNGTFKTVGWDVNVGWRDKIGDVGYSIRGTLSDDKNEITKLGGVDAIQMGYVGARQGYPLGSFFGYKFDGMIQNQTELDEYKKLTGVFPLLEIGDARFSDVNNDEKIDQNDVIYLGNLSPRYRYGLDLSLNWKGFDFIAFFQGVGKRSVMREGQEAYPWLRTWYQPSAYWYGKTWSPERTDAPYPRLLVGDGNDWNWQPSQLRIMDAFYLRLKNIQIGYTLPVSLSKTLRFSRARIYFSGQDILTLTKMPKGYDPEAGRYQYFYPFNQIYSAGLDINF